MPETYTPSSNAPPATYTMANNGEVCDSETLKTNVLKKLADAAQWAKDQLSGIFGGTLSMKSVKADGTGGAAASVIPGWMVASAGLAAQGNTPVNIQGGVNWPTPGAYGNPASTAALKNDLRALLVPKAWCRITTDGAGTPTLVDGANIASVTSNVGANTITITFAQALDAAPTWTGSCSRGGTIATMAEQAGTDGTKLVVQPLVDVGGVSTPNINLFTICVVLFGRQS